MACRYPARKISSPNEAPGTRSGSSLGQTPKTATRRTRTPCDSTPYRHRGERRGAVVDGIELGV